MIDIYYISLGGKSIYSEILFRYQARAESAQLTQLSLIFGFQHSYLSVGRRTTLANNINYIL